MSWILPPSASTFAAQIDFIYYVILVITGIAFVVVEAGLIWFVIKYRARPGRKAYYTHGNITAEIVWTTIPAVTVVMIGLMSGGLWKEIKGRDSVPPDAIPFGVKAEQFEWTFTYRGLDGELGTADDFSLRNQLHIPVNQPVALSITSEDVIHAFFVPAFRVKQDIVPGLGATIWFEATETGDFEIACAELCGLGHYRMRAMVTVHSAEDYQQWVTSQTTVALAE